MPEVRKTPLAENDLIQHFIYLAENASIDVADRFLVNAEAAFNDLAQQPSIGAALSLRHPDLAGMRKWRVKEFDNFLIFYLPRRQGVTVIRVLHAAQDWWSLFDIES